MKPKPTGQRGENYVDLQAQFYRIRNVELFIGEEKEFDDKNCKIGGSDVGG